jgi:hypothetical protein
VELGWIACVEGNPTEAATRLRQAVDDSVRQNNMPMAGAAVEALAEVAVASGRARAAARTLGAAVALRGIAIAGSPDVARITAAATAAIGPDDFAAAYAEGLHLSQAEALRLA